MPSFLKDYGNCTGPFGFPMKEQDARELDDFLAEHTKDSALQYQRGIKGDAFEYFIEKEHADVSVITDGSLDKQKEIIDPSGVDFEIFRKNAVVTLGHNYRLPPVGKSIWQTRSGDSWKAKTIYVERPENHPKEAEWIPDSIWHFVKNGFMNGKSVGFLPVKWHQPTPEERQKNAKFAKADLIWDIIKVFEYAVCTVQCNDNAIVEEVAKGYILPGTLLETEFERLSKLLPEKKITTPEPPKNIKGLTTEDHIKITQNALKGHLSKLIAETPAYVTEVIERLKGRV